MSDVTRSMTVRLPEALAAQLDIVADIQFLSTAEAIRIAVTSYVDDLCTQPLIREGLRRRIEEAQQMLGTEP